MHSHSPGALSPAAFQITRLNQSMRIADQQAHNLAYRRSIFRGKMPKCRGGRPGPKSRLVLGDEAAPRVFWREQSIAGRAEISLSNIRDHFDQYARTGAWQSSYSGAINTTSAGYLLRRDCYADLLSSLQPTSVVDVGCGSGDYLDVLPNTVKSYLGLDFSREMVVAAQKKADESGQSAKRQVSFLQADVLAINLGRQFDFVIASGLIEYFEDIGAAAAGLSKLIKPGGHIAVQTPNRNFYRWRGLHYQPSPGKSFQHHRISFEECDSYFVGAGLRKVAGIFFSHNYFPTAERFPRLYMMMCKRLRGATPRPLSAKIARNYLGVYCR